MLNWKLRFVAAKLLQMVIILMTLYLNRGPNCQLLTIFYFFSPYHYHYWIIFITAYLHNCLLINMKDEIRFKAYVRICDFAGDRDRHFSFSNKMRHRIQRHPVLMNEYRSKETDSPWQLYSQTICWKFRKKDIDWRSSFSPCTLVLLLP